jgi:uncharacterized membrane protein
LSKTASPNDNSFAVKSNRWTLRFSYFYLRYTLIALAIFAGLPVLAPVMMQVGAEGIGRTLYQMYRPFCHQLAYRSFFMFGEQPYYPRQAAPVPVKPYETYLSEIQSVVGNITTNPQTAFEDEARAFYGNSQMGYKMAVCQRDIVWYWAMFAGGLIYAIPRVRRHLRPCPIWLYVLLGLGPIGVDGFSQLFSDPRIAGGALMLRETTPFFRSLTGLMFGLMTAWMIFPYLEASARETIQIIEAKFKRRTERLGSAQD